MCDSCALSSAQVHKELAALLAPLLALPGLDTCRALRLICTADGMLTLHSRQTNPCHHTQLTSALLDMQAVESSVMRRLLLDEGFRADGRSRAEVRPIRSRAGLLPSTHGSALFTRGETQAIAVATLGELQAGPTLFCTGGRPHDCSLGWATL